MRTPICDFVQDYLEKKTLRLHMPGHKGQGAAERRDITEISGADVLYPARSIIRESEENASALFGSAKTFYSTEGASLCIRAMLFLARMHAAQEGRAPLILAGRNAHRSFWTAAALMDFRVEVLQGESLLTCRPTGEEVTRVLDEMEKKPAAVYLTSPDYLGFRAEIRAAAEACHARGVPLLVDNAHGAYLKFLPGEEHPLDQGADLVCDSAHKTLPVLTGGAYLHTGPDAPEFFSAEAERALEIFASTSPSWLILQSLDRCNARLGESYPDRIRWMARQTAALKKRLSSAGYEIADHAEGSGSPEPMKITLFPRSYGYTGNALHGELRKRGIECEFSDPDSLVMMVTPETGRSGLYRLETALKSIPSQRPVSGEPPALPRPERVMSLREAMMSPAEEIQTEESRGRILADACISCPPAVPILTGGERIDGEAVHCFRYYGIDTVLCVREGASRLATDSKA